MALVVEDGTGKADADSYVSAADATAYHASRGNAAWALLSDDAKDQALRKAADYMVQKYRTRWLGTRMTPDQALDWPREGVVVEGYDIANDEVPALVERAAMELALRASAGPLQSDKARGGLIKRQKIGPLETEYMDGAPAGKEYSAVDDMLAPLLGSSGGGNSVKLERC